MAALANPAVAGEHTDSGLTALAAVVAMPAVMELSDVALADWEQRAFGALPPERQGTLLGLFAEYERADRDRQPRLESHLRTLDAAPHQHAGPDLVAVAQYIAARVEAMDRPARRAMAEKARVPTRRELHGEMMAVALDVEARSPTSPAMPSAHAVGAPPVRVPDAGVTRATAVVRTADAAEQSASSILASAQIGLLVGATTVAGIERVRVSLDQAAADAMLRPDSAGGTGGAVWNAWRRGAIVLDALSSGRLSPSAPPDPLTRAAAERVTRLVYASSRAPDDTPASLAPLDLPPRSAAIVLHIADASSLALVRRGVTSDIVRAITQPPQGVEPGRPAASIQFVSGAEALARAEAAGGAPWPLLSFDDPTDRPETIRRIWTTGITAVPASTLGLPLYTGGGDIRALWDAPGAPLGIRCVLVLRPEEVLHLHGPHGPLGPGVDEARFTALAAQARSMSNDPGTQVNALRALLLHAGYRAIARYDHRSGQAPAPQEVIALDPSPETLLFVMESVPSFVTERVGRPTLTASP